MARHWSREYRNVHLSYKMRFQPDLENKVMDNWQGLRNTVVSYLKGKSDWQSFGSVTFKTGISIEIIQAIADAEPSTFDVSKNGKVLKLKHEWLAESLPPPPWAQATEAVLEYAAQLY